MGLGNLPAPRTCATLPCANQGERVRRAVLGRCTGTGRCCPCVPTTRGHQGPMPTAPPSVFRAEARLRLVTGGPDPQDRTDRDVRRPCFHVFRCGVPGATTSLDSVYGMRSGTPNTLASLTSTTEDRSSHRLTSRWGTRNVPAFGASASSRCLPLTLLPGVVVERGPPVPSADRRRCHVGLKACPGESRPYCIAGCPVVARVAASLSPLLGARFPDATRVRAGFLVAFGICATTGFLRSRLPTDGWRLPNSRRT